MQDAPALDASQWADMTMFWLENEVTVTFHSDKPYHETPPEEIIRSLRLKQLNQFLNERGFLLESSNSSNIPRPLPTDEDQKEDEIEKREHPFEAALEERFEWLKNRIEALEKMVVHQKNDGPVPGEDQQDDINNPLGKYLFPSPSDTGTVAMCFFNIKSVPMPHAIQDLREKERGGGCCDSDSNTRQVVNMINQNLDKLRQRGKIPIIAAMPNWLGNGSPTCGGHGGPGAPPIPFPPDVSCGTSPGFWPIQLPDLDPKLHPTPLADTTGEGVTVFVLDTMPKCTPEELLDIATKAGNDNHLLPEIAQQMMSSTQPFIKRIYQKLPDLITEGASDYIEGGQDIYGELYGFDMKDHGLFVTGIVRDIAPRVNIEYIRVLNDAGTFDTHTLIHELHRIQKRIDKDVEEGGLRNQPVVINLSLTIMPSQEELAAVWFESSNSYSTDAFTQVMSDTERLRVGLHKIIQSLTHSGVVIVAAAGNDSNNPETPMRIGPRYPAAFSEVISVGAVDRYGKAASYSNYPALPPNNNGIATYGGAKPQPVPPVGPGGPVPPGDFGPDPHTMTTAEDVDGLVGVYSSPRYPALAISDSPQDYKAPSEDAWAFWCGTSFATPIISGVAARVLQLFKLNNIPHHLWPFEAQQAFTTAIGQKTWLTGDHSLPPQADFNLGSGASVSLLRAYQCREREDC